MSDSRFDLAERTTKHHLSRRVSAQSIRAIAIAMIAVGGTMAACSASGITSPSSGGGDLAPVGGSSKTLGTGLITNLVPLKTEVDPDIERNSTDFSTSTETTFPYTETVTNSCWNNETPVLNGYLKQRERIVMDDLTLKYKMQTWADTRGVAATAPAWYHDDDDPATPPRQIMVRYRNKTQTLDKFEVGPAGLPFSSDQESRMHLERLSPEHGMKYGHHDDRHDDDDDRGYRHGPGDDLFVYARTRVYVDKNGNQREKTEFRTECR
jgi:hypothetical protein